MTETDIQAAPEELLALARTMRPLWDHDVLASAILAAKNAGWTWDRTLAETVRLMRKADASPFDLRAAAAKPARAGDPAPGDYQSAAAKARELLAHRDAGSAA